MFISCTHTHIGLRFTCWELEHLQAVFHKLFCLRIAFDLKNLTKGPPIPADVNIGFPDDRCLKLQIYILELILDRMHATSIRTNELYDFTLINLLKTKRNLSYIRNQSVPRSKLFQPRL